jgi:hypothetical protein
VREDAVLAPSLEGELIAVKVEYIVLVTRFCADAGVFGIVVNMG